MSVCKSTFRRLRARIRDCKGDIYEGLRSRIRTCKYKGVKGSDKGL